MSDTKTVQVAPAAALGEQVALVEHYRNRNLLLAHRMHELQQLADQQAAEIERLNDELAGRSAAKKKAT